MPISKKYNLTFIHIPKNGGSSIEETLNMKNKTSLWDDKGPLDLGRYEVINNVDFAMQHYTWDIIRDKMPDFYDNSIKFAFVRNPYTRIVSEYIWLNKIENFKLNDFKKWLNSFLKKIDNDHKLPQYKFVPDDINFLCRFENFNDDFKKVLNFIGLGNLEIQKQNQTKFDKTVILNQLDLEAKQIISNVYEKDFEIFNYKK